LRATYDEVIARLSAELRDLRARVKLDSREAGGGAVQCEADHERLLFQRMGE
jgi:hypothetical protein